jgi:hypothetical protein
MVFVEEGTSASFIPELPSPHTCAFAVLGTSSCLGEENYLVAARPRTSPPARPRGIPSGEASSFVVVDFLLQPFCYSTTSLSPSLLAQGTLLQASSSPSCPLIRLLLGPSSPQAPIGQAVTPFCGVPTANMFPHRLSGSDGLSQSRFRPENLSFSSRVAGKLCPFLFHVLALASLSPRHASCCESAFSPSLFTLQHRRGPPRHP